MPLEKKKKIKAIWSLDGFDKENSSCARDFMVHGFMVQRADGYVSVTGPIPLIGGL